MKKYAMAVSDTITEKSSLYIIASFSIIARNAVIATFDKRVEIQAPYKPIMGTNTTVATKLTNNDEFHA